MRLLRGGVATIAALVSMAATSAPAPQQAEPWVFLSLWPAQAGARDEARPEVMVTGRLVQWRELQDRNVLAARYGTSGDLDAIATLRRLTARLAPGVRERGSRHPAPDSPLPEYLEIASGTGATHSAWADETSHLDPALVRAGRAVLEAVAASATARDSASSWVQTRPLDPASVRSLQRSGILVSLETADLAASEPLAKAWGRPFAWIPVERAGLAVAGRDLVGPNKPSAAVTAGGRAVQVVLQTRP